MTVKDRVQNRPVRTDLDRADPARYELAVADLDRADLAVADLAVADLAVADLDRPEPARVRSEALRTLPRAARIMSQHWIQTHRISLFVGDTVATAAVVGLAIATTGFSWMLAMLPVAWAVIASLTGAYRPQVLSAGSHDLRAVLLAGVVLLAIGPLLGVTIGLPRDTTAILAIIATTGLASIVRFGARLTINARRRTGGCTQRVVVVGEAQQVIDMVERLRRAVDAMRPVAVVVPADQAGFVCDLGIPVAILSESSPESTVAAAGEHNADAVLLVPGGEIGTSVWRGIARACEWSGFQLMFSPSVVDVATSAPLVSVAGAPVLVVPRPGPTGSGHIAKQLVDRAGAALGLLVLAPVLAAIAIAVRLDSPGRVLFRQVRVGVNGRRFTILKFRTMHHDAEAARVGLEHRNESEGPLFKLRHDPRVTRVGRVLRRLSLDELPQLVNVFAGQMSMVGPRPPLPKEVHQYTRAERRRLLVKPGLTGLWQVGGRSTLGWAETIQLDIRYVESWSLPLDLRILARTIPAVFRGTGAF